LIFDIFFNATDNRRLDKIETISRDKIDRQSNTNRVPNTNAIV